MPEPAAALRSLSSRKAWVVGEARFPAKALETYRVLGKNLSVLVSEGMTKEHAFMKAVEDAGGKVFRKFYKQFNKFEITAVVFRDAALVKNDPEHIAEQDFSSFGEDAEKVKRMVLEEAKKSEGGIHFFENGDKIPVIRPRGFGPGIDDEYIIFPAPNEMLVRNGTWMDVRVVDTNIDPKTIHQFKEGARALREGDTAALERLRKAGGAHAATREKDIEATSDYVLLDARTGEEIGAAAANAKLGKLLRSVPDSVFVPETILINRFIQDSQRMEPQRYERAAWEVFYLLPRDDGDDGFLGRFGIKLYGACRLDGTDHGEEAPGVPGAAGRQECEKGCAQPAKVTGEMAGGPDAHSKAAGEQTQGGAEHASLSTLPIIKKAKMAGGLTSLPPQAMLFDGFSPAVTPQRPFRAQEQIPAQPWQEPLMSENIPKVASITPKTLPAIPGRGRKRRPRRRKPKPAGLTPVRLPPRKKQGKPKRMPSERTERAETCLERKKKRKGMKPRLPAIRLARESKAKKSNGNERPPPTLSRKRARPVKRRSAKAAAQSKGETAKVASVPSRIAARPASRKGVNNHETKAKSRSLAKERERIQNPAGSGRLKDRNPKVRCGKNKTVPTKTQTSALRAARERKRKGRGAAWLLPAFTSRRTRARSSSGKRAA
jgi:hypothetical protein